MIVIDSFIKPYFIQLDSVLNNYVYNGYRALVNYMEYPLAALIIIAIGFLGWRCWTGVTGEVKVADFFKFVFQASFIYYFAMNWANFSELFMALFNDGIINGMGSALLQANPLGIPGVNDIASALQLMSILFDKIARALLAEAGFTNLSFFAYGLLVYVASTIMIALIMLELTMAKIMMAILFVMAPIIIPCCLFERTKNIFNHWLGNLVGFSLLILFVTALMGICSNIILWSLPIKAVTDILPIKNLAVGLTPMLIILVIVIYSVSKVHAMAMHIGGGVATGSSAASVVAGAVGGLTSGLTIVKSALTASKSIVPNAGRGGYSAAINMDDLKRNTTERIQRTSENATKK